MSSPKSSLGWLLLVAVLAVPAVLFWKWWTEMQFHSHQDRAAGPVTADAFKGPAAPPPVPAPGTSAPQAAAPAPGAAPVVAAAATAPAPQPGGPPDAAAAQPPAAPAPSAAAAPAQPPAAAPAPGAASTAPGALLASAAAPPSSSAAAGPGAAAAPPRPGKQIEFAPSVPRDPTLSQLDMARMKADEEARERARQELLEASQRVNRRPVKQESQLDSKIDLQGVVATPNGMMALVSGESLREGDQIFGFVVTRITTRYVTFKAGSRTFTKRVE
jgi:hypothetical protein